jgi:hypothetical protein
MRPRCIVILAGLIVAAGCGGGAKPSNGATAPAGGVAMKEKQPDADRESGRKSFAASEDKDDADLDHVEQDALKALGYALGKNAMDKGGAPPDSSGTTIKSLRAAKVKLRLDPVTDDAGKANDSLFILGDSYTDRSQELGKKSQSGKRMTPGEIKELTAGIKLVPKITALKLQVLQVGAAALISNSFVQRSGLSTMLRVSNLVRTRKLAGVELDDADYALVKRALDRQRRAQTIAASTMGMLAGYQAVLGGTGDPSALDKLNEQTMAAFPVKPSATPEEAKSYVANLGDNVAQEKARYEAMLRKVYGDARYEKDFKTGIDAMFEQAQQASSQKSVQQMVDETRAAVAAKREAAAAQAEAAQADGSFRSSLEGIDALKHGNARLAIQAAIKLAPLAGPVGQGLSVALKLLFN